MTADQVVFVKGINRSPGHKYGQTSRRIPRKIPLVSCCPQPTCRHRIALTEIPLTQGGRIGFQVENAMAAVAEGRWDDAVALLEAAYEGGFDVAELHAMLAYARFQASGLDEQTAIHAFELLDYAQAMDPSLDLVHAYRGAIHRAQGDIPQAREALDRALELNPYCELAMEIMDAIG